jgi:hypothetical protein
LALAIRRGSRFGMTLLDWVGPLPCCRSLENLSKKIIERFDRFKPFLH